MVIVIAMTLSLSSDSCINYIKVGDERLPNPISDVAPGRTLLQYSFYMDSPKHVKYPSDT